MDEMVVGEIISGARKSVLPWWRNLLFMYVCRSMSLPFAYLSLAQDCCTPVTLSLGKEIVFPDADANVVSDAISFMFNFEEAVFRRVASCG